MDSLNIKINGTVLSEQNMFSGKVKAKDIEEMSPNNYTQEWYTWQMSNNQGSQEQISISLWGNKRVSQRGTVDLVLAAWEFFQDKIVWERSGGQRNISSSGKYMMYSGIVGSLMTGVVEDVVLKTW